MPKAAGKKVAYAKKANVKPAKAKKVSVPASKAVRGRTAPKTKKGNNPFKRK